MSQDERAFATYRDVNTHKWMLQDVVRTEAYELALQQAVKRGDKVLDFGSGTGVLSIFAARSGAAEVFAVERRPIIAAAEAIAKANHIDTIRFCHADHDSLELDTEIDLIVSEWMGHFLFCESMLTPLLKLRDRYLAEGGTMIPAAVALHVGLICDADVYEDLCFLRQRPYGIDFSPIADSPLCQTELDSLQPDQILEAVVELGTLDLRTLASAPRGYVGTVHPEREATIYGLCGWFSAQLVPGIGFGTGPRDQPTHWQQVIFPLRAPFEASPDRAVTVRIVPPEDSESVDPVWAWSIEDSSQRQRTQECYLPRASSA